MPPTPRKTSDLAGRHPAKSDDAQEDVQVSEGSRAHAGTQERTHGSAHAGTQERTHARDPAVPSTDVSALAKTTHDAAYAWAAVQRKAQQRAEVWASVVEHARHSGVSPAVLRQQIGEAAERAGLDLQAVPVQVWHAAGIDPPDSD